MFHRQDSWLAVCLCWTGLWRRELRDSSAPKANPWNPWTPHYLPRILKPKALKSKWVLTILLNVHFLQRSLNNLFWILSITLTETPNGTRKLASWKLKSMNMWRSSGWVSASSDYLGLKSYMKGWCHHSEGSVNLSSLWWESSGRMDLMTAGGGVGGFRSRGSWLTRTSRGNRPGLEKSVRKRRRNSSVRARAKTRTTRSSTTPRTCRWAGMARWGHSSVHVFH